MLGMLGRSKIRTPSLVLHDGDKNPQVGINPQITNPNDGAGGNRVRVSSTARIRSPKTAVPLPGKVVHPIGLVKRDNMVTGCEVFVCERCGGRADDIDMCPTAKQSENLLL